MFQPAITPFRMKPLLIVFHLLVIAPAILGQPLGLAFPDMSASGDWDAQQLGQLAGQLIILVAIGIALAVTGYRLFDKYILGELRREQSVSEARQADHREG